MKLLFRRINYERPLSELWGHGATKKVDDSQVNSVRVCWLIWGRERVEISENMCNPH